MDYEKKYKDALEFFKHIYPNIGGELKEQIENLFPELKENEDERVRKAILGYLTIMWGNSQDDVCGVHVEDAIAWLEKQGEQKPKRSEEDENDFNTIFSNGYKAYQKLKQKEKKQ